MKKKILFVTPHMICGGVEKSLISIVNEIPKNEYEVTILMVKARGEFLPFIPKWVTFGELPLPNNVGEELLAGGAKASILKNIRNFKFIQAIKIFVKRAILKDAVPELSISFETISKINKHYDIAVAYHMHMPFIVKYVAEKINADKKIAWIHNDFKVSGFNPRLIKESLDKYTYFFAVSKQLKEEFLEIFPSYNKKTDVFYNIISSDLIQSMSKDNIRYTDNFNGIRILSIGRLDRQKGYDLAIKVCERLVKDGYKFKWYVIGDGVERKRLEKQIKQCNVYNNFFLMGIKTNPYPYLRLCDIYVQPSRHEGYCTTVNEARILQKPIVTTNVAGVKEMIINNETGLVTEFNEEQIYMAVKTLIDDQKIRRKFENNLKKQKVDTSNEVAKLLKLF